LLAGADVQVGGALFMDKHQEFGDIHSFTPYRQKTQNYLIKYWGSCQAVSWIARIGKAPNIPIGRSDGDLKETTRGAGSEEHGAKKEEKKASPFS
jgi:hypothetical protein